MHILTPLFKAIFSRKWIAATIFVIMSMAVMARLGIWQLDRLEQRRAANAVLAASLASAPLLLPTALPDDLASIKDRQIVAAGQFDLDRQLVLLLKKWHGRTGVHLITPFLIADSQMAVLVDRGWIPQADYDNGRLGQYDITGPVQLEGYAGLSQPMPRAGNVPTLAGPQTEIYRINIAALQPHFPYDLLPIYIQQAPQDNSTPPFRAAPEIDLSEGPHLGYALQWFLFTTILGGGYLIFVYQSLQPGKRRPVVPPLDESAGKP